MTQKVSIDCDSDAGTYQVVLEGTSLDVFHKASQHQSVKGKTGEELVTAILAALGAGDIVSIGRFKGYRFNDGPNGEPALQEFYENGKPRHIAHRKNDKGDVGVNGEPTIQEFNRDGELVKVEIYKNDQLIKRFTPEEIKDMEKTRKIRQIAATNPAMKIL